MLYMVIIILDICTSTGVCSFDALFSYVIKIVMSKTYIVLNVEISIPVLLKDICFALHYILVNLTVYCYFDFSVLLSNIFVAD